MADAEISLINKVELRIALAKSDEKLSSLLQIYLPPLLLKLTSPHESVRSKVIEVCQHVNQRVRTSHTKFPVQALLDQFKNPNINGDKSLMQSFDLMYIQLGIDSLSPEDQAQLVPIVINGISALSINHSAVIFRIFLKLLNHWTIPDRGTPQADNLRTTFGFDANPKDAEFISDKICDLFFLDQAVLSQINALPDNSTDIPESPGLSPDKVSFFTKNNKSAFTGPELFQAKLNCMKLFSASLFTDREMFFPLLAASHDSRTEIFHDAESTFKRLKVDMEDKQLVDKLYDYAVGITVAPVKPAVLANILQLCCKSRLAANLDPFKLIQHGLQTEYRKCTQATSQYVRWVAKEASDETLTRFASDLIKILKEWIEDLGWPKMHVRDTQLGSFRSNAYEAIGALIRRSPNITTELESIQFLFDSLENDTGDMKPSVQEALSEILPVLDKLTEDSKTKLKERLLRYFDITSTDQSCRYIAVRYAVRVAPYSDSMARLICIVALARENRSDVIEEAKRGLHPYWFKTVNANYGETADKDVEFPDFSQMLNSISSLHNELSSGQSSNSLYGLQYNVYSIAMTYLERILVMKACEGKKSSVIVDEQWEQHVDTALEVDDEVRSFICQFLQGIVDDDKSYAVLAKWFDLLYAAVKEGHPDLNEAAKIWLQVLSLSPSKVVENQSSRVDNLVSLLDRSRFSQLKTVANGLGILATCSQIDTKQLIDRLSSSKLNSGNVLALAFMISRLGVRDRLSTIESSKLDELLQRIADWFVESHDLLAIDVGIEASFQLLLFGIGNDVFVDKIKEKLLKLIKAGNDRPYLTFGCIPFVKPDSRQECLEIIYENTSSKQTDIMFASGEALTLIAAGWDSKLPRKYLDIQGLQHIKVPKLENQVNEIVDTVITKCSSSKPQIRKFACIWLLSLAQYCGHLLKSKQQLELMHLTFMKFLADRDEVLQEVASRGLGIIYDLGDSDMKEQLVKGLVKSFTSESTYGLNSGAISEDTELFEPGVLNTGDGSISTYKDILNLASEVGDASLVYKFMSLAASSSLWTSKKGAAFGLGSLLSKTNIEDLFESDNKLSKNLIPKLYRYRFDPIPSVQQTMRGIWDSLVKNRTKVINDHFFSILDELIKGMGDREWRTRQASTVALSDLLQSKRVEEYQDQLQKIWLMSFRTIDDVKDSVRNAGMQLTKGLASSMVRYIDVESGSSEKVASEILKDLIPFLTGNTGIQSDSKEVQEFALNTLLKLCKKGGKMLRPYIPGLVEEFLDLLSTLEPQGMNYLALNADKYGLTNEQIDASRMQSLRSSPMMEAIDQMIDQTDKDTLNEVIFKLSKVIKRSVGLPSKLGGSRILVTLVLKNGYQLAPFADNLLLVSKSQLTDRNETVAQSYAISSGYLCRSASQDAVLSYAESLKKLYFDSDNDRNRLISATAAYAVSRHASDKFSSLQSEFLPFIFIGKHDNDETVRKQFEQVWEDNTGGKGAIKLYLSEILQLANQHLSSLLWNIRQVVARSIASAVEAFQENLPSDIPAIKSLFDALFKACSGKSWDGKEKVFQALTKLSISSKELLSNDEKLLNEVDNVVLVEIKRRNKKYQSSILPATGKYIGVFPNSKLYETFFSVVDEYLTVSDDKSSDEDEGEDVHMKGTASLSSTIAKEDNRNKILEGVVDSFSPVDRSGSVIGNDLLVKLSGYLVNVYKSTSITPTWRTELVFLSSISSLAKRLRKEYPEKLFTASQSKLFYGLWTEAYDRCCKDLNQEKVRVQAARLGGVFSSVLDGEWKEKILKDLKELIAWEKSPVVIQELELAVNGQ